LENSIAISIAILFTPSIAIAIAMFLPLLLTNLMLILEFSNTTVIPKMLKNALLHTEMND